MDELQKIMSRDNSRLIAARRVRDGHGTGQMFVEGRRLAFEALRSDIEVSECFISERFAESKENGVLIRSALEVSRFVFELPDRVFRTIAATDNTQGIVLIGERPGNGAKRIEDAIRISEKMRLVVLLDQVNNPLNLGAVIRSAEAAGAAGVIVTRNSTDVYSAKSLRASMGSAFRLAIWDDVNFDKAMIWAGQNGLRTVATAANSDTNYWDLDWSTPRMLVFGSEAHGLDDDKLQRIPERIRIPMAASVESLNLAVAAGIMMFEAKRQNL